MRVPKSLMISFLLSSALGLMPHAANAIVIDEFSENYTGGYIDVTEVGETQQKGLYTSTAIGGARRAIVKKTEGSDTGRVSHYIVPKSESRNYGYLVHDQGTNEAGSTTTIWDGSKSGNAVPNNSGLGGIDFTVDGSTAFTLKFAGGDFQQKLGATIIISVYEVGNSSPYTYTYASSDVGADDIRDVPIYIPFADFKNSSGVGYNFKDVGAISLKINGERSTELDVSLYQFMTNGECDYYQPGKGEDYVMALAAPASSYEEEATAPKICCPRSEVGDCGVCKIDTVNNQTNPAEYNTVCFDCQEPPVKYGGMVKDPCGICGGDGSTCQDCENVYGGPAKEDLCGECYHDAEADPMWNKTCADCNGVPVMDPAQRKQFDQCNVCGGDGTTCLDCKGVINGTAEFDLCGECILGGKSNTKEWNASCLDCNGNPNPDDLTRKTLDYCGVCGGDNSGSDEIFGCNTIDTAALKKSTTEDLTTQKTYLNQMASRIKCATKKNRKKIKQAGAKLLSSSVTVLENFPASTKSCSSEVYCKSDNNSVLVAGKVDLSGNSRDLFKRTRAAIKARQACIAGGACLKTYEECLRSKRLRNLQLRLDRALARKLRDTSLEQIKALPTSSSNCDCKYAVM